MQKKGKKLEAFRDRHVLTADEKTFVYRADFDTTGMLLSGDLPLVGYVRVYLDNRARQLAKKSGYSRFVVVPAYGKRSIVLMEGKV